MRARSAFTLFEVAVSLALVAVAITSLLLLFASGLKSQQLARFKLVAAAKAEEMVESFASSANSNPNSEVEGPWPWEVPASYRSQSPDLEVVIASHRYGVAPLPLVLARRLDSDNDEIQKILDGGGYLYYAQPMATTGVEEVALPTAPSNETQKLVFAVSGYAQQNAVAFFPWKCWPYYAPYPSPPSHGFKNPWQWVAPEMAAHPELQFTAWLHTIACWEGVGADDTADQGMGSTDSDIALVFAHRENSVDYGFKPYAYGNDGRSGSAYGATAAGKDAAIHYLQAALWYCARKGLPGDFADPSPVPAPQGAGDFVPSTDDAQKWKQVMAMRFLAHAATCLTRWASRTELDAGIDIPSVTLTGISPVTGTASAHLTLTHAKILYYHERCLNLAMSFAALFPYDWAVPRPTQRAMMMDYPLIEWDLWSSISPLSGTIYGSDAHGAQPAKTAEQWRPIAARPLVNVGRSMQYPDRRIPLDSIWGDQADFTLTQTFSAAERCRQIVFWAVDWQSYSDFETAPGAPIDASKYLFAAPILNHTFDERMTWDQWTDHHVYAYRNPEKNLAFKSFPQPPAAPLPTGFDVWGAGFADSDTSNACFAASLMDRNRVYALNDHGTTPDQLGCFRAAWGADRNFNHRLDRGPIPPSVRLRALSVARYNYYDPRLTLVNR